MSAPDLFDIEEFFADPEFTGVTISPDGKKLAYLAPAHGRTNVWVRGIDEADEDAVCVTNDSVRGITTYYWTDDPRWLLYRQDTDGNEDWHLYRVDLQNAATPAVDLTPLAPGGRVALTQPISSMPGKILVSMNERPDHFDLFVIDIATGEKTLHREEPEDQSAMIGAIVGADGRERFRAAEAEDGTWEFYAIDDSGDKRLLTTEHGPAHPLGVYPTRPTADNSALLISSYGDGDDLRLVRVDHETGERTVIAAVEGHSLCTMGAHGADFGYPPTLFLSRRTGDPIAARFVGDRPIIVPIDPHFAEVFQQLSTLSDGVLGWVSSDETEQRWVATFLHDREPDLTYFYDHSTGESRLLFRPFPDLDPAELSPTTSVRITARDGLPLHGLLTLPVGVEAKNLPLVLMPHGGPWAHDSWGFGVYHRELQFLANRGYAVLQPNFRGSTGYGRRHITAAIGELAGAMHDDLIDFCEWAIEQGIADRSRIAIYGGSYGGYAALVGATFTPDYFAAVVDYVGISSLMEFMSAFPDWVKRMLRNNWLTYAGDPDDPEQAADMIARSPLEKVDEIRTPLLVIQGAQDSRVNQSESDIIVNSLRERGVPVEYYLAENEGHYIQNVENLITMFGMIERLFAQHLGGRSALSSTGSTAGA